MTTTLNTNPISSCVGGVMKFTSNDWDKVYDCVDYPVFLSPLFWFDQDDNVDDPIPAQGETNTGRMTQFFGVNVDRNRTGDIGTIAVVTDTYGTLNTKGVYEDFKMDLDSLDIPYTIQSLYVSGNGGSHILSVLMEEVSDVLPDVRMQLSLQTSVDGTKRHQLRLSAFDIKDGREIFGVGGTALTVSARHTKTVGERHAAFSILLTKFIKEWRESVVPMMALMNDFTISKNDAIEMVRDALEKAAIPERHIVGAVNAFDANNQKISALSVVGQVSGYFTESLSTKKERYEMFRDKISRHLGNAIKKMMQ